MNFEPAAATCSQTPYAFRPMYATSSEHTRVPWAAHSYNVAFSDEIGHFEYCSAITEEGGDCLANNESALDDDDTGCFERGLLAVRADQRLYRQRRRLRRHLVPAGWPGTDPNRGQDAKYHPTAITFTSPLFNGTQNYSRVAFETELPRIEARTRAGSATASHELRQPPPGSNFYPIYTTGSSTQNPCAAGLRLAVRRALHQGHDQYVGGNSAADTARCCSASTRTPTRRFGGGRTTSATCSARIPVRPSRTATAKSALRGALRLGRSRAGLRPAASV